MEFKDAREGANIGGYKNHMDREYLNDRISCKRLIHVEKGIMENIYGSRRMEKKDFWEGF